MATQVRTKLKLLGFSLYGIFSVKSKLVKVDVSRIRSCKTVNVAGNGLWFLLKSGPLFVYGRAWVIWGG